MNIPNPQEIVKEAEEIARKLPDSKEVQEFLNLLRYYVSPETPTQNRAWGGMIGGIFRLPIRLRDYFSPLIEDSLQPWEEALGYRSKSDIMTFQEYQLIGGTVFGSRTMNPYIPVGFYDGNYSVEEVNKASALQRFSTAPSKYFSSPEINQENGKVTVTLETTSQNRKTLRDPQPVNADLELILGYTKSMDFPFRRE